jgi:hypothetical protein
VRCRRCAATCYSRNAGPRLARQSHRDGRNFSPYLGAGVVLLAFFLAWGPIKDWYYRTLPERNDPVLAQIDPICQFVERLGLRCLSSPSAESLMGPGRYVRYTPTEAGAKVPPLGVAVSSSPFASWTA